MSSPLPPLSWWKARSTIAAFLTIANGVALLFGWELGIEDVEAVAEKVQTAILMFTGLWAWGERIAPKSRLALKEGA